MDANLFNELSQHAHAINSQLTQLTSDTGNTKSVSPQVRRWCFTHHLPNLDDLDKLDDSLNEILLALFQCEKYAFQLEKCPNTGKYHYQGYCEFKNGRTFNGIKELIDNTTHWEKAHQPSGTNYAYCTKVESRVRGPWVKGFPIPVLSPITTLRPWQQKVWDLALTKPDDRKIHWFYDYQGNTGKTALAKHLVIHQNALYVNGKASDVKCAVAAHVELGKEIKTVIWGIPRSQEKYVSYAAIEEVKDGLFFSGKYESKQILINPPHIFVFSNFYPETTQLSADRWVIINVAVDDEVEGFMV